MPYTPLNILHQLFTRSLNSPWLFQILECPELEGTHKGHQDPVPGLVSLQRLLQHCQGQPHLCGTQYCLQACTPLNKWNNTEIPWDMLRQVYTTARCSNDRQRGDSDRVLLHQTIQSWGKKESKKPLSLRM